MIKTSFFSLILLLMAGPEISNHNFESKSPQLIPDFAINSAEKAKQEDPEWIKNLPIVKELPDPFLMDDGSRVSSKAQWTTHREEIKKKIQYYEYGHLAPASPVNLINQTEDSVIKVGKDMIRRRTFNLSTGPGGAIKYSVNIFMPAKTKGSYPVVITGDLCWGSQLKRIKPEGVITLVKRGYLIVEFDRTKLAPDKDGRSIGVYPLYPDYDWGSIAAWAWGFHRTIDFLLTQSYIDKSKICVTGHSRGGKTALLAGAFDERIALVAPNCSGTSGSGPIRFVDKGGETIDNGAPVIFPFWFNAIYQNFKGENRDRLPFDQHSLIALVAPRAYLCTNGLKDLWANPKGTAQAHLAAGEVFTALGARNKMGIFYAETGHDHDIDKWTALLDFADQVFFGKKASFDYTSIPFPDMEKAYSWSVLKLLN